jgi:hypothetical protein
MFLLCSHGVNPSFQAAWTLIRENSRWDAILFWDRFDGRWLRGTEFHYPERPADLPSMKLPENWPKSIRARRGDRSQDGNVLVWTASHPHGSMALSASQLDERKV